MFLNHNLPAGQKWGWMLTVLTGLTLAFNACKKEDSTPPTVQTITDQINGGSNFTLLKAALSQAGLSGALGSAGTYTLLAPTDDAFKAFGLTSEAIIKLAPVDLVKSVIQYHVLPTKLDASTIPAAANTAQQTLFAGVAGPSSVYFTKPVAVTASGVSTTAITVNGAHILQANQQASNGIIHVIDRILLPPIYGSIPTTIAQIPTVYALLAPTAGVSFKLLQQAVTRAGATTASSLSATGPLTVFAPTDNAFKASGFDSTKIANTPAATLATVLGYHVVPGRIYTPTLTNGASLSTAAGAAAGTLTIGTSATAVTVTGKGNGTSASNIVGPDVTASNGVIQIIDRLLLPQQ
ncbi:fasciclin domain-containing protein [Spirosoma koreense]